MSEEITDETSRITALLDCVARMEELVDTLPEPERSAAQAKMGHVRRELQAVIDALVRH